jgi:putative flippase GtrA
MAIEHSAQPYSAYGPQALRELAASAAGHVAAYVGRDFLYFLLFGGLAAMVNLAIGLLLYGIPQLAAHCPYWLAVGIGATGGLFVNFLLNYNYNFRFRGRSALAQFRTFCIVAAGGILLTALFSTALLSLLHSMSPALASPRWRLGMSPDFVSHFCAIGLVTLYSYAAHKCFTFNVGIRGRVRGLVMARHG